MIQLFKHFMIVMALTFGLISISGCSGGKADYTLEEVQGNAITFISRSNIIIDKQALSIVQLEVDATSSVIFSIVEGNAIFNIDTDNNLTFANNVTDLNITESNYTIIVEAKDSFARAANQVIQIEVVDDINQVLPQIDSGYNTKPFVVYDDLAPFTQIDAYNPRGSDVSYTLEGTDNALFDITSDGQLHLKNAVPAGVYEVVVVVTDTVDGVLFSQTNTIVVTVVASEADLKPTILSENFEYIENDTSLIIITSASSIPDTLIYTLGTTLDSDQFSISNTGELAFKVVPDHEIPTDIGLDNSYEVEVIVTDGNAKTDTTVVSITVFNVDDGIAGLGYINFEYNAAGDSWYEEDNSFDNLWSGYNYRLTMVASPQVGSDQVTYSLQNNSDSSVFVLFDNVLYMYVPYVFPDQYSGNVDVVAHDEHGNSAVYLISILTR